MMRNPGIPIEEWIPAFAGMTEKDARMTRKKDGNDNSRCLPEGAYFATEGSHNFIIPCKNKN
ncbi:hypothetical protein KBH77_00805 [Patescibacteria group bacterium]|nr:hypothetical protein [Patescibacteria group bacterium]